VYTITFNLLKSKGEKKQIKNPNPDQRLIPLRYPNSNSDFLTTRNKVQITVVYKVHLSRYLLTYQHVKLG